MPSDLLQPFLIAWAFGIVLMGVTWFICWRIKNAGLVDIAWSGGFAPIVIFYAVFGSGYLPRRELAAFIAVIWSVRLALHVLIRVKRMHPREDSRYEQLREDWGASVNKKMFWFYEAQSLLLAGLTTPFLVACYDPRPGLSIIEIFAVALWVVAFMGECIADHQLAAFRGNPANKGRVCQAGLWNFSRHPNYFFEWLIWVTFFLFAVGSPWGWATIYCPIVMLFFLLKVTGIPMTEQLSLKSKGDAYRAYQKSTSMFVPWFKKRA